MAKSPSVSLIEKNISSFASTASDTILAMVGYATKGPINKATKITSFKEFRKVFGYPTFLGFSSIAAQRAFNQGNNLIFYRVAETEGDEAALASKFLVKNSVDALDSYAEFTRTADILYGAANYINGIEYSFTLNSKLIYMKSPSSGRWTISDMLNQMTGQLAATSGYQEFTEKTLNNLTTSSYLFKLTLNGTLVTGTGSLNSSLMVDINAADTIESVATKVKTAILGGSRSYSYAGFTVAVGSLNSALNLAGTKYNFLIRTIEDGTFIKIVISNITTSTTLNQIVTKINTELVKRSIPVICLPSTKGLYFFNKTYGAGPYVEVDNGDSNDILKGTDLFAASLAVQTPVQVAGISSGLTTSNISVAIDDYTKRIRIVSGTTGTSSSVDIGISDLITDLLGTNFDLTDASYGLGLQPTRDGQATIANVVSIEKNTDSNKIRISTINSALPIGNTFIQDIADTGTDSFLTLMPVDAPVTGYEGTTTLTTDVVVLSSKEVGSSTKNIAVEKTSALNPVDNTTSHTIKIYYDGELQETFANVSMTLADETYFVNVINDAEKGSSLISVEAYDNSGDTAITFPNNIYQLGTALDDTSIQYVSTMDINDFDAYDYIVGTDGIPVNGGESLFVEALNSAGDLANKDVYDYHILLTPDNNEEAVQNAALALAEGRKDFVYLVDPPFGLSYDQVRDWHNGIGTYGRSSAVASSYAMVYWPWLKDYDSYAKKYVWVPPSVFLGEKLIEVDTVYKPWAAPAGEARGKLTANDSETSPSFAEREELYGDFNCINPIVDFYSKGLIIYGQKTAAREDVAVNRINVRRMVIYIKKLIKKALDSMLFEPNNTESWQRASSMINSILENVRQGGGIDQFLTVIDATTNTPDIIAQNMMSGIVKIVPTGTIEIIELNINVYKSGSTID